MNSRYIILAAALPLSLVLAGCSPDEEPSAMDNVIENSQEYHNTATDPAGPRELTPPANLPNE